MTAAPSPPRLIVSLPGRSIDELRAEIAEAHGAGADWGEVRVDRLSGAAQAGLDGLFPSPIPLLATYRSAAEGGAGASDPSVRATLLQELARQPFAGLDLEIARDLPVVATLPAGSRELLASVHLPEGTSPELRRRARDEPLPPHAGRKIVVGAGVERWIHEILPEFEAAGASPRVLLATGPASALSRAWARRSGSFAVFAGLPRPGSSAGLRPSVEPGQLPVDRLRRFFAAEGGARLAGLAGRPVAHSRSPDLFDRFFVADGTGGLYVLLECADDRELVAVLPGLVAGGFRGLNVTHPFKAAALIAASRVDASAEACGVANCLTFESGEIEARNTDLAAIRRRLAELRHEGRWDGRRLAIVGAGGAARATLAAARELGARATIYARRPEVDAELARSFGAHVGAAEDAGPERLIVHATPFGRAGTPELEIDVGPLLDGDAHLLDWVYAPEVPTLRHLAAARRASYEDGWSLLVYQAAASYAAWWGREPAAGVVAAAREERP